MIKNFSILFFVLIPQLLHGQITDTTKSVTNNSQYLTLFNREVNSVGLIFGINQFSYTNFEIGIAKASERRGCIWGSYFHGLSLSADYRPFPDSKNLGILITAWHNGGPPISWGLCLNSYTDFERANIGVKPMLGFGVQRLQLVYGYNFQIINNDLARINKHNISLRFYLLLRTSRPKNNK